MIKNQPSSVETLPLADLEKLMPPVGASASRSKSLSVAELAKLLTRSLGPGLRLLLQPATLRQLPRILHEGIDPMVHLLIQANNIAVINKWLNKGAKVVFLSSYPRSGNTWMRFMLSDILLQMHGIETATQLPVHPDNLIAEFRSNSIIRRLTRCPDWAFETSLAFVKTHALFERLKYLLPRDLLQPCLPRSDDPAQFRDCRVLYLYRSPEDVLVSLFHYGFRDDLAQSRARLGIDDFCLAELPKWIKNISSYLRAADHGFPVYFFSYESLMENPATVLGGLLQWLGVQNDQMVQRAVSNMQFGKLQAMEREGHKNLHSPGEQKLFFRRGRVGSGRVELQDSTLREIQRQTASLMTQANHYRMQQQSPYLAPAKAVPNSADSKPPFRHGASTATEISPQLG